MNCQEFIEILETKGYSYELSSGKIIVTHHSDVYIRGLMNLPANTEFENQGAVALDSLTNLPEGTKFKNQGFVFMRNLTKLPEGTKFENRGSVDLDSLTSLPEGTKFANQGFVFMRRLDGKHTYQGRTLTFRCMDGYTMIIGEAHSYGGYKVSSARFFAGGPIDEMDRCYIAESDDLFAHGATMREAVEDLKYKDSERVDRVEVTREILKTQRVTLAQFRAITGACTEGTRRHLAQQGIQLDDINDMDLDEARKAMAGTVYGDIFAREVQA